MGSIMIIQCPKCKAEIRRADKDQVFFAYGSPFQICPSCKTEYFDRGYREMALCNDPPENKDILPEDQSEGNTDTGKKNHWWQKKKEQAPSAPRKVITAYELYELSDQRLSDYDYLVKLYNSDYLKYYPQDRVELKTRLLKPLKSYIDLLENKLGPPNVEYKVRNVESFFSELVYDAKNAKAVEQIVREVLCHYGVNPVKYQVQVVYQDDEFEGTLGTFTETGLMSGIVRVVLIPCYSEYDVVVAVILHECAHALLYSRMISLPDKKENERLTDIAAIYMGGGEYLQRGYFMYKSFHVGYLQELECDLICEEIKTRRGTNASTNRKQKSQQDEINEKEQVRKQIYDRKREMIIQIEQKMKNLPVLSECVHPNRVIREQSVVTSTHDSIVRWKDLSDEIESMLRKSRTGDVIYPDNPEKAIELLKTYEKAIDSYVSLLKEWQDAEKYQSSLSAARIEYVRKIKTMAESGNVFAQLEMVRFWVESPATVCDAIAYYSFFRKNDEDPDSLYASGICCLQGLAVDLDENEGKSLLCKAAALGSKEAAKILDNRTV